MKDVTELLFYAHNTLNAVSIRIIKCSQHPNYIKVMEPCWLSANVIRMDESKSIIENGMAGLAPLDSECQADTHVCPDGSVVSRILEDGCNFAPCDSGTGLFFPVWRFVGAVACSSPPSWASGAYLK